MNFSRCKTFLQIVKSYKNLEFHRLYSNKFVFSSASPQEISIKHKITNKYDDERFNRTPQRKKYPTRSSQVRQEFNQAREEPNKYFRPYSKLKGSSKSMVKLEPSELNLEDDEITETEQLFKYTNAPQRKPRSSLARRDYQPGEPSKYFQKPKPKSRSKPVVDVEPRELYPEGEIDAVDELADKKSPEDFLKSQRVNHKLWEDPKYKIEYTRDPEETADDSELKREISEFEEDEKKSCSGVSVKVDLRVDEFNLDDFVKQFNDKIPGPLDECRENLSDLGTDISPTFNFAAYADHSKLVQTFTDLGVKLYKVEKNHDHMRALLTVDLEKELPLYIQFLHDCGVPADSLGDVITDNPMILKEDMEDLKARVRYLLAHNFSPKSIARIVTKNPTWLTWATKHIDERLGHFQNEFKLAGTEIRFLATKQPKLITYRFKHVQENTFAVKEIMGFTPLESKILLLTRSRLWMNSRKKIVDSFDYLHNTMKLSHLQIVAQSEVLTTRRSRLKNRHEFLVELKKAQYDPKKIGYISPHLIAVGSDEEFCSKVAKTSVDTYNMFLKTRQ